VASVAALKLDRTWWRATQPAALNRSGRGFEKAIEAFTKAKLGLKRRPDAESLGRFEAALEGIEDAARAVVSEAKKLKRKADSEVKSELTATISVLGTPLTKRVGEWRDKATELETELDDNDDDIFGTLDNHRAYVKRMVPRLKRNPHKFALCLPSNDPEDMRFCFHRSKQPRALGLRLKKHLNTRRFTYGIIGGEGLARQIGIIDLEPRTLVVYLQGRTFPSLARRIRILLRKLKIAQYSRVRVIREGEEVDVRETDEAAEIAGKVLDKEALAEAIREARSMPGKAAPPGVTASLRRRIWACNARLKEVRGPKLRPLVRLSRSASSRVDKRNFHVAMTMVDRLEKELIAILGKPSDKPADANADAHTPKAA